MRVKQNTVFFKNPQRFGGGATITPESTWGEGVWEENMEIMKSAEWMSEGDAGLTHFYR